MAQISGDEINLALSRADGLARRKGHDLVLAHPSWVALIERLSDRGCPKTYLPVLCVLLTARVCSPQVDVLKTQFRGQDDGYSAASIGTRLIPFATMQGIDLRSKSTQIMNNQPFTFVKVITDDLTDHPKYPTFFKAALQAQELTSDEALEMLALTFHVRRSASAPFRVLEFRAGDADRVTALKVFNTVATFVETNSDGGRVGQALGAALFDCLYGPDSVQMKKINDPSFSSPGDFSAGEPAWRAGEAKQVEVSTGTVENFARACLDQGIERVVFLALGNARYEQAINVQTLDRKFGDRLQLDIYQSPTRAIQELLEHAPGSPHGVATNLASRLLTRLLEIDADPQTIAGYEQAVLAVGLEFGE